MKIVNSQNISIRRNKIAWGLIIKLFSLLETIEMGSDVFNSLLASDDSLVVLSGFVASGGFDLIIYEYFSEFDDDFLEEMDINDYMEITTYLIYSMRICIDGLYTKGSSSSSDDYEIPMSDEDTIFELELNIMKSIESTITELRAMTIEDVVDIVLKLNRKGERDSQREYDENGNEIKAKDMAKLSLADTFT